MLEVLSDENYTNVISQKYETYDRDSCYTMRMQILAARPFACTASTRWQEDCSFRSAYCHFLSAALAVQMQSNRRDDTLEGE